MFERFTDRARRAMTLANQEAQRLVHDHIGTEHLLLGLVKEGSGTAAIVLREFKVDLVKVRQQVEQHAHGPSRPPLPPQLTRSDRYKRVVGFAIAEAESLGHNYVGTEHLLLGLLHLPDGTAAKVLSGLGLKLDDVRAAVLNLLGAAPASKDKLLELAMKDLSLHLADEQTDAAKVRTVAEVLIQAGWRPQQ
jgi:ATP-dependent Clp protease ATP-binding subunit ClpC